MAVVKRKKVSNIGLVKMPTIKPASKSSITKAPSASKNITAKPSATSVPNIGLVKMPTITQSTTTAKRKKANTASMTKPYVKKKNKIKKLKGIR